MSSPGPLPVAHTAEAVLAAAARALSTVLVDGRNADAALANIDPEVPAPAVRAITLGALRWYWQLQPLLQRLLAQRELSSVLQALMLCALHQLEHSRNPAPAVVSSAVDASRRLRQSRAAGMINALLRRYLRERTALLENLMRLPSAASAHPQWLLQALQRAWPEHWHAIVEANNEQAPMTVRVDLSRTGREAYRERLAGQQLQAWAPTWIDTALVLERAVGVDQLPGFAAGEVSVQDAGAQLAAQLLDPQRGERVLDACAAPGGKSAALLERVDGELALTALDIDAVRLQRVQQTLTRLRRQASIQCADLRSDVTWWSGEPFDRILLDAPCSASGVIRRHPDIKLLRRPGDIAVFAQTQQQLLQQCLGLLRAGGRLLYCTCSLLPAENDEVIEALLAARPQLQVVPLQLPRLAQAHACRHGWQLLPANAAPTDGFYYACLTVT